MLRHLLTHQSDAKAQEGRLANSLRRYAQLAVTTLETRDQGEDAAIIIL